MTHVSPQYHVVFDDQFSSVLQSPQTLTAEFYQQSIMWQSQIVIYIWSWPHLRGLYTFDSYWADPPIARKKRHKHAMTKQAESTTELRNNSFKDYEYIDD
jgi:hypothetical protein